MRDAHAATLHATAVACHGHVVLLLGASGSGKSDLALRLIDRGAMLVADDRVVLRREGARLLADPPATIAGRMEMRGVGIVGMPWIAGLPVALAIGLGGPVDRLPQPRRWDAPDADGLDIPYIMLDPTHGSAPMKVEAALALALAGRLWNGDD